MYLFRLYLPGQVYVYIRLHELIGSSFVYEPVTKFQESTYRKEQIQSTKSK